MHALKYVANSSASLRGLRIRSALEQLRFLNLQEYQSKEILDEHGCTVQRFFVAETTSEASQKLQTFNCPEYVVKAQILAGGRGRGRFISGPPNLGGVFITTSKTDALESISQMLGRRLVTKQTQKDGVLVRKVMVAESIPILRETYLAFLMDREYNGPVVVHSPAGGVDIEEVAEKTPDLIYKEPVDIAVGITKDQCRRIAENLKFKGALAEEAADQIRRLYELFLKLEATQIEINPFVETGDHRVFSVDAKLNFDESAAFRQKAVFGLGLDSAEESDPREVDARKHKLNYIGLDGNIACLVNGAGLAMATMDIIKLFGGSPANFLDVGGTVTEEQVFHAFRILTADHRVQAILVNIFGGIVNCVTIANGLIQAFKRNELNVPLVVRLEGTNVEEARRLLTESSLPIMSASNLQEAAQMVVEAAEERQRISHGETA